MHASDDDMGHVTVFFYRLFLDRLGLPTTHVGEAR
jgi:hypothetical protein